MQTVGEAADQILLVLDQQHPGFARTRGLYAVAMRIAC